MFKIKKTSFKNNSDEELMLAIQNGDCNAFNDLYSRYNERLYYYFYRMLGHQHLIAEDFLQDLFVKVISKPHYFDLQRSFSTWIFSMAHNMCKNEYRSRQVRTIVNNEADPDRFVDEEKQDTNDNALNKIFAELDKMDESHKTAFLLKYREGFTIEEISEIMDLPMGTIKSRLFYTRNNLRNLLTKTLTY